MPKKSIFTVLIIFFLISSSIFSQNIGDDKIIGEKRALFLVNIIEQIEGFKFYDKNNFKIGVFEDDIMFNSLKRITRSRDIKNREVSIKKIRSLTEVKNINALYIRNNDDLNSISLLNKVRGKSILLITENNNSGNSMVNISLFKDNFYVEVIPIIMIRNGFKASSLLLQKSLSSIKDLNELLALEVSKENKEKEEVLNQEKNILESIIKKANTVIEDKNSIIIKEKNNNNELQAKSKKQDNQLKEKIVKLEGFEKNYTLQQQLLNLKTEEVNSKRREISIQDKYLKNQKGLIEKQQKILKNQKIALNNQNRINTLFIIMGILSLGFMIYIIKININRKDLLYRLKQKHKEVAKKSSTLEMQNKELEQFAYIASHDLQEPLHTITSFADFMYEDYKDILDEEGKDNLNYIKSGCNRMENLVKSLLDYSRIGSERKLKYLDSKKIVDTIIQDFNALINETKAQIYFGHNMPMIYAYPTELRMLFQNIISNAIKFRKPNSIPKIYIEGEQLEKNLEFTHRWRFKIRDNGIGIASEHQKKIFDIFQRLHTREDYEGTGIGLAHCKKVIMFHHGDIWVNSALGSGTIFNFTIQFNPEDYEELSSVVNFS